MPSCLGLYIEEKLIKYAKVSVEKEKTKIENFGVKFYEDITKTISQIIEETASEKTPISISLNGEEYDYFKIFSLLKKNDLEKAIATEVDSIYFEKGVTKNSLENRYILVPVQDEAERSRVINISVNKSQIMEKSNMVKNSKLINATPIPAILPDLINFKEKENALIINIEDKTTFTSIINGKIFEVEKSNTGMSQILEKINFKENSYAKSYEICKNTTIFTSDINEIDSDSNLYLEDIMPTLYNIVQDATTIIGKFPKKVDKIYITGSASLINNIDLYFKEYVMDTECVILKPHFIDQTKTKINIKDYIEVNSAIALAYTALNEKEYNINFLGKAVKSQKNISLGSNSKINLSMPKLNVDLKGPLDSVDVSLIRGAVAVFLIFVIYSSFSSLLTNSINKKNQELSEVKTSVETEIKSANNDLTKLQNKMATYKKLRTNLENINEKVAENYRAKNAIPNLLYHIMNIIPVNVQITSIENVSDKHIVINAQTTNYEYLAYFTAGLKNGGILTNVVSGTAQKDGDVIKVTIEGDLQ